MRTSSSPATSAGDRVKVTATSGKPSLDREWTNKELADRLDLDPSTVLHHVRLLVDAGLLESVGVRQGQSGAYEKPYRSTGLSWKLSFDQIIDDEEARGEPAMLNAFRTELHEAGHDSVAEMTRFHLHLDDEKLADFIDRFKTLVDEFADTDAGRRDAGQPGFGGMFIIHRLSELPEGDIP